MRKVNLLRILAQSISAILLSAMIFAAGIIVPASAQNSDATPTYGEISLSSGFDSDAHEIRVQAGGPISAAEQLSPPCVGYFSSAPDVILEYQGSGVPLRIYVESESDTTLIIEGPDFQWHCEDDVEGLNPAVLLPTPESGTYAIWVGTYRSGGNQRAMLRFSESIVD